MTMKVDIREDDQWYTNTPFTIKFRVWQRDRVTPRDVTGYALSWMLKRRVEDPDASALLTKTTPTIVVTGVFNTNPTLNTQLVEVPILKANTVALKKGVYAHELKRTDTGLETVLCSASAVLKSSAHRT